MNPQPSAPQNDAAAALSAQLRPALIQFFLRRCGNTDEAEDLVQDVLMRTLQQTAGMPLEEAKGYIFRAAVNRWNDRQRRLLARGQAVEWNDAATYTVREQDAPEQRRLGLEMDTAPLTPRCFERLKKQLPRAQWVDAELLVNQVRLIKSDAELVYIRQAAEISRRAMQAAYDAIEPGVRECDAAAKVMAALVAGTERFAGHLTMQGAFSMPSGERTSAPHLAWTEAPFRKQQLTSIELGGCRHAYHAGLSRSFFLGGSK